jgi:hypothetical protein
MDFTRLVRNRSSRNGSRPRLMVLHTTEGDNHPGIRDLEGLAGWFDNPDAQASRLRDRRDAGGQGRSRT